MPQPLFIQCLRLNLDDHKEINTFLAKYKTQVEKRYNTGKEKTDIEIETSQFDPARLPEAQKNIQYIVNTWHTILNTPENDTKNETQDLNFNMRQFKDTIKHLPLPKTQAQYFWTTKFGLIKRYHIRILPLNQFLYQELLETMHEKFNALDRCHAPDCNNFFVQKGRKDKQIFCANPCRNRIRKRESRERERKKRPRKK